MGDALKTYKSKRNFTITPEPAEGGERGEILSFVIQKHWASRLHYDFRLELDGTMKSWAVPKGPSFDSKDKRMAVHVEDHPISYSSFEGTIPEKQYGAGKVIIWDKGTWQPLHDPHQGYADGNLKFEIHGHKMQGKWVLVRMKGRGEKQEPWLLIKEKDGFSRSADEFSVVDEMPDSVNGLPMPAPGAAPKQTQPAASAAAAPAAAGKAAKAPRAKKATARTSPKLAHADAKKAALPASLEPQLATLVDAPPALPSEWVFELKFDGYRLLTRIDGDDVQLFTRKGNNWTHRLLPLQAALIKMQLPSGWYDGEIVVHDAEGRPDFGALQLAFDNDTTSEIQYFLFDLPFFDGYDLRAMPLVGRREVLQAALERSPSPSVHFSAELDAPPADIMVAACKLGLEGLIGKRRDAAYVSRRSSDWVKLKCGQRQEFVIGGYTDPQGAREGIGALLVGTYDEKGKLRYAGKVGSGFNQDTLADLKRQLSKLDTDQRPFAAATGIPGKPHWVRPELLAEISFAQWTSGGSIRHAVFQGLRQDKSAKGVTREVASHVEEIMQESKPTPTSSLAGKLPPGVKISHADRLIDAASGATKIDLVRYYALVGELMLVHLKGRPVSLVRAPAGVGGELFFQKHAETAKMPGVKQLDPQLDADHSPMLEVATAQGLLSAAQWNVLELHTQNAYAKDYERPNRMVFDLDPGKDVTWAQIQEAALLMRAFLEELGLTCFLKTSGGKGLHVVTPIKPMYDWDTVKAFSQAIVAHIAATIPERFVLKSGPKNRVGKIFIDYLRNGRGSTTACAWSARARPGLGISVPIAWEELASVTGGDHWTVHTVHTRLDQGNRPWEAYAKSAKSITKAIKQLGFVG